MKYIIMISLKIINFLKYIYLNVVNLIINILIKILEFWFFIVINPTKGRFINIKYIIYMLSFLGLATISVYITLTWRLMQRGFIKSLRSANYINERSSFLLKEALKINESMYIIANEIENIYNIASRKKREIMNGIYNIVRYNKMIQNKLTVEEAKLILPISEKFYNLVLTEIDNIKKAGSLDEELLMIEIFIKNLKDLKIPIFNFPNLPINL